MMKKLIQTSGFWYGIIGSFAMAIWYVLAWDGRFAFPTKWWETECLAGIHGIIACFTFQPRVIPPWRPLFSPTQRRLIVAKVALTLAALNFAVCLAILGFADHLEGQELADKAAPLILTSFLLLNTVYFAAHWAYRPENLLPRSLIRVASDPLGAFLGLFLPDKKPGKQS